MSEVSSIVNGLLMVVGGGAALVVTFFISYMIWIRKSQMRGS